MEFILKITLRALAAVIVGIIIGSERAHHGRAAGMRTHILVALGASLTAMISLYAKEYLGYEGDILRLSAQVISGVGFLGAGMIILKNNSIITGLTTAAGVLTTGVIGIALGCGFYFGAAVITFLYMVSIILLGKLERPKKQRDILYIEIDSMYMANEIVEKLKTKGKEFTYHFLPPKSGFQGHLGISLLMGSRKAFPFDELKQMEHIVFYEEE